jgi:hypothetical protein
VGVYLLAHLGREAEEGRRVLVVVVHCLVLFSWENIVITAGGSIGFILFGLRVCYDFERARQMLAVSVDVDMTK